MRACVNDSALGETHITLTDTPYPLDKVDRGGRGGARQAGEGGEEETNIVVLKA